MLIEKFKGKKVKIITAGYANSVGYKNEGLITKMDTEWIELDNNLIIAIKYILKIEEK